MKKKFEIIEKMTRKSQASGSSGYNYGNFSHFNEYDGVNYEGYTTVLVFNLCCIFINWLM